MGTLPVNSVPALVLFDSGASHSFLSEAFALTHDMQFEKMHPPLVGSHPPVPVMEHGYGKSLQPD